MAYQSLYRRYRPTRFDEVRGQDHVTLTLRNAVRDNRVSHAYLFSGPRGTGKTSTARILAKALNCAAPVEGEPCGKCESCLEIADGRSLDVIELDAASNRGIDAMRDLVARVSLGTPGRWKVYIVDEVHMLTTEASNTLLKTLEEPPGHVIFVLATTEPQKVLPTIQSRTQHFEFRLLSTALLEEHLRWVASDAGLDIAPEAIEIVARKGSGSARDALSVLDQVAAAGGVEKEPPSSEQLIEALCEHDAGQALVIVAERCNAGHDPRQLVRELLERLRQGFLALMSKGLVGLPDEELARVEAQARRLGPAATVRAMEVLGDALVAMREAPDPRVLVEVSLVRLCRPDADTSPGAIVDRLERLERAIAGGQSRPTPTPTPAPPSAPASASSGPSAPPAAPAAAPASPPAPMSPTSAAREALAARPAPAPPPPAPPAPPSVPSTQARQRPPASVPKSAKESTATTVAPFPTRDELTLAWGDGILAKLPRRSAVRFQVGRFVGVENDVAVYALPNPVHRDRCEEVRAEVEHALSEHFRRRIPLRVVVDSGATPTASEAAAPDPKDQPAADDDVDVDDLRDAPPGTLASPVDHVLQAFEGAKVIEE
ncbi:MAG TPA: DNA polymerase III subunit gamma/tau [Acidimicrobiales bacterium]|nr:DNA polymerase III subunit gamma/tau [Acidimicrobiales bacterium]